MHLRSCGAVLLTLVAGCGGKPSQTPDAPIAPDAALPDAAVDAAVDAPIDADNGAKITITRFGGPIDLTAYRDGATAAWQTLNAAATSYEITVHGPYVLSYTCERFGNITTVQISNTPDDPRTQFIGCDSEAASLHVTGQMVQPGAITIGGAQQTSTTPNWSFDVEVAPGTYDVFAMTTDRVELRRDLVVAADTAIATAFDVDTRGVPLLAAPFTVNGAAPGDDVHQTMAVQTAHAFVSVQDASFGDPAQQKAVPTSLLTPTEFHKLLISAFTFGPGGGQPIATRRIRRRWNPGQPTDFTFPDRLGAIAYTVTDGKLNATWSAPPNFSEVEASALSHTADFSTFRTIAVSASRRFIDASAANITLDLDIPGFKPEWRIDYTKEYLRSLAFTISRGPVRDDRDESEATETVNEGQFLSTAHARAHRSLSSH